MTSTTDKLIRCSVFVLFLYVPSVSPYKYVSSTISSTSSKIFIASLNCSSVMISGGAMLILFSLPKVAKPRSFNKPIIFPIVPDWSAYGTNGSLVSLSLTNSTAANKPI